MKRDHSVVKKRSTKESFDHREWLSQLWRIPFIQETEPKKVDIALRERIKELNCLYGIARLAQSYHDSMEDFLRYLVDFLPESWQYPEITTSRIVFKDKTYRSRFFKTSRWQQSARILVYNEPVGEVTIAYAEEKPAADEGPFLKEERVLLEEVARHIGTTAIRISAEQDLQEMNRQLSTERIALQEANSALRTVLAKIEEEKKQIYRDVQTNIEKIIRPILHSLALELLPPQRKYLDILRNNLEEIASPYISKVLNQYRFLTPTEIAICNMIRNGLRTKEIAKLRNISLATVNRHRENIRKKLKITNNNINLITYLQSNP
jgi:DNA-binding CsgD family transcriptional regulator